MKPPRGLSAEEAAAWAQVAATVKPLRIVAAKKPLPSVTTGKPVAAAPPVAAASTRGPPRPAKAATPERPNPPGLDSHWDRRFRAGSVEPDFTLDLHGHTLDQAHARLDSGLGQAKAMGARVVLIIAGKSRPVDAADRGTARGAIRAKLLDWLAAGPHGGDVAAVRKAHRRHGGDGALYLVLKRKS
ncbi:Smr/MutS family protein [Tsuneonella sp. HG249]